MVQLSHLYITTRKTIVLTRQTFVGKVMSLIFNMLSRFDTAFKEQVSFNFMAAVIILSDFGAQENKICHYFHFFCCWTHAAAHVDSCVGESQRDWWPWG